MSDVNFLDRIFYEPAPTEQEKALWDKFVEEYVKDFSPYLACLRVGFADAFALQYGKIFLLKPYVQQKIAEYKNTPNANPNQRAADEALIAATYREMAQNGNGQTRVAAATGLARLYGLDKDADADAGKLEKIVETMKELSRIVPD